VSPRLTSRDALFDQVGGRWLIKYIRAQDNVWLDAHYSGMAWVTLTVISRTRQSIGWLSLLTSRRRSMLFSWIPDSLMLVAQGGYVAAMELSTCFPVVFTVPRSWIRDRLF
jgi:hypothetical protein